MRTPLPTVARTRCGAVIAAIGSWSVLEIGWPNPVDLDGLGVDRAIRVDLGAPRLALAPALAFTQHFDETDFDDDARGSPGKRLLANELTTKPSTLELGGSDPFVVLEDANLPMAI
jgi:hypothetical protein